MSRHGEVRRTSHSSQAGMSSEHDEGQVDGVSEAVP
jgi:hypothetical protein